MPTCTGSRREPSTTLSRRWAGPACRRARSPGSAMRSTRAGAFLSRPIEGAWPYLWIDATYQKVREAGRIVSTALIVAVGVNADRRREVLGVAAGAGSGSLLEDLPELARRQGPARRQARRCRRPQGAEGGCRQCVQRHPSALPRALAPERAGARAGHAAVGRRRDSEDDLRPGHGRSRARPVVASRRRLAPTLPQAN